MTNAKFVILIAYFLFIESHEVIIHGMNMHSLQLYIFEVFLITEFIFIYQVIKQTPDMRLEKFIITPCESIS